MTISRNRFRFAVLGLLIAVGFAFAPASFARSHWNVGVNIGFPGFSLGYSDCRHCGRGWGGNYYGGYYSSYYAPAYYAPTYYAPAYYSSPAYYGSVYYDRPYYRSHYSNRYDRGYSDRGYRGRGYDGRSSNGRGYDRGRDYGQRATYYDRGYNHR